MPFHPRGRFQLIQQPLDDGLRNGGGAVAVLGQELGEWGFKVGDFDAGSVVGPEVDPFGAGVADGVGGVQGEVPPGTEMLAARFPRELGDAALVL